MTPVPTTRSLLRSLVGGAVAVVFVALCAAPVSAQDNGDYNSQPPARDASTEVSDATATNTDSSATEVKQSVSESAANPGARRSPSSDRGALPFTGSDVAQLAAVGVILVAAGGAVLVTRRRATSNARAQRANQAAQAL